MSQPSAHRIKQMLVALRYFAASPDSRSRSMGARKLSWGTITLLQQAGLIEAAATGSSVIGAHFRATNAGRAVASSVGPQAALLTAVEKSVAPALHVPPQEEDEDERQGADQPNSRVGVVPRLALNRAELAASIGVAPAQVDEMIREGFLPGARRWRDHEVWIPEEVSAELLKWLRDV